MSKTTVYEQIAIKEGLPTLVVERTYKAYWLYIKTLIQNLPLKEDLTEDQFNSLRTCFNIPSIGKLHCTYSRYLGMKKRFEYIKRLKDDKHKEDSPDVYNHCNNNG